MSKREPIIKTREPGPEFQALASDWKPTKRRAWLVPSPAAANAEPAYSKSAEAESASARQEHAGSAPPEGASTESASTETAHAEAAIAKAAYAESANAGAAIAKEASAASAGDDSAQTERAHAGPATAKGASTGSANAGSAKAKGAHAGSAPPGIALAVGGWTKTPNWLFDVLVTTDLSPRAVRVLLLLVRQTYGYHRRFVELSNTDLAATTNIHISHITSTVKELVDCGYVSKTTGGGRVKSRYCVVDAAAAHADSDTAANAAPAAAAPCENGDGSIRQTSEGSTPENFSSSAGFENLGGGLKKSSTETFERNSLSKLPLAWKRYTDPRGSPENRPMEITSKAANGVGRERFAS